MLCKQGVVGSNPIVSIGGERGKARARLQRGRKPDARKAPGGGGATGHPRGAWCRGNGGGGWGGGVLGVAEKSNDCRACAEVSTWAMCSFVMVNQVLVRLWARGRVARLTGSGSRRCQQPGF